MNLKELHAYYNKIEFVTDRTIANNLQHLALGYNLINDNSFGNNLLKKELFSRYFPNLLSLDLSFNNICNLVTSLIALSKFKNLKLVWLIGNPICLVREYKKAIAEEIESLKFLDGVAIPRKKNEEDEEDEIMMPVFKEEVFITNYLYIIITFIIHYIKNIT